MSVILRKKCPYVNTQIYSARLRIQYECGKIQTSKTNNTGTFHAA